jgi:hypothetical protein
MKKAEDLLRIVETIVAIVVAVLIAIAYLVSRW